MSDEKLSIHYLLKKQMQRAPCTLTEMPPGTKEWQDFLLRVSRAYFDMEQERYLLDRAMEISSFEMNELNKKLEDAQGLAHMGYWSRDLQSGKGMWTAEMFNILGRNPNEEVPSQEEFYLQIIDEDREKLKEYFNSAVLYDKSFEFEFRVNRVDSSERRWCFIKGRPERSVSFGDDTIPEAVKKTSGIIMDITERKNSEEKLKAMHEQLLDTARLAGMSEVATSVLHNVGNVLNSANVALTMLKDKMKNNYLEKLKSLTEIIKKQAVEHDSYFANDPKGKTILEYLCELTKILSINKEESYVEIENLNEHLDHIKSIVLMQNSISGLSGVYEKINLSESIDLAIQLSINAKKAEKIHIIKDFSSSCIAVLDKAKLLQILVNMIRNAQDSLVASTNNNEKVLSISLSKDESNFIIAVGDNGMGITEEVMKKIFTLGFTTKETGHGFGLHSSAIAAKELGGSLNARSDGLNKGATFILGLPLSLGIEANLTVKRSEGVLNHESA